MDDLNCGKLIILFIIIIWNIYFLLIEIISFLCNNIYHLLAMIGLGAKILNSSSVTSVGFWVILTFRLSFKKVKEKF